MDRPAERSAPFKPAARRPAVAHWPTPDERALFETIDRISPDLGRRKEPTQPMNRLKGFWLDASVALAVALGTFGAGISVANALTALPI